MNTKLPMPNDNMPHATPSPRLLSSCVALLFLFLISGCRFELPGYSSGNASSKPTLKDMNDNKPTGSEKPMNDIPTASKLNQHLGVATHFSHHVPHMEHWDAEKLIPMVAEMGVGWIRDEVMWRQIEPEPGVYVIPEITRNWLDLAKQYDLKVIAIFSPSRNIYGVDYDPHAYAKAAAFIARELKDDIHAIEVINEPFNWWASTFGEGVRHGEPWFGRKEDGSIYPWISRYVEHMNITAEAIHEANPDMPILGLGNPMPVNYSMLELGVSPKLTGITDHPYSFKSTPEIMRGLENSLATRRMTKQVMADELGSFSSYIEHYRAFSKKHGGPEEIWLTEWGFSTFKESERFAIYRPVSELAKCKYSLRRIIECLALDVEVSIIYSLFDDEIEQYTHFEPENHFGLIRPDFTRKPSFYAIQNVANATAHFKPIECPSVDAKPYKEISPFSPNEHSAEDEVPALNSILSYAFEDQDGNTVIAIWSAEQVDDMDTRTADVRIGMPAEGAVLDVLDLLDGNAQEAQFENHEGEIFLKRFLIPEHPLLITVRYPKEG